MNQSGTGSPCPSETSKATQEEPLAIDRVTVDARELPLVDSVRESGPSGDVRGFAKTSPLAARKFRRLLIVLSVRYTG